MYHKVKQTKKNLQTYFHPSLINQLIRVYAHNAESHENISKRFQCCIPLPRDCCTPIYLTWIPPPISHLYPSPKGLLHLYLTCISLPSDCYTYISPVSLSQGTAAPPSISPVALSQGTAAPPYISPVSLSLYPTCIPLTRTRIRPQKTHH